jgi:hypothetical protein
MRCATVGAAARNARAISSVASPQTSRSVSAICASGGSADGILVQRRPLVHHALQVLGDVVGRNETCLPAQSVDGLEARRGDEPGARIGRNAFARPLFQRHAEGIVQRFLGDVEIPEQPDQRGQDAAGFVPVDGGDGLRRVGARHSGRRRRGWGGHRALRGAGSRPV